MCYDYETTIIDHNYITNYKMWQSRMHCNLRPPNVALVVLGCFG